MAQVRDNIILLQSYYKFLLLGKYIEHSIQKGIFAKPLGKVKVKTGTKSTFDINTKYVEKILQGIATHPDQKNIFGYLVEMSAIKGIVSVTRELIENNIAFQKFLQKRLGKSFFDFDQIIRLIRNIFAHSLTSNLVIKTDDFIKQRDYLIHEKTTDLHFLINYSKQFKEWKGSADYQIDIAIDFKNIKEGQSFFDHISMHQCYLLCEFCYNVSEIFRKEKKIV
ncbi:MAG: hypothetical protein WC875_05320 [Candidatus Absconditabacterales bacterium]